MGDKFTVTAPIVSYSGDLAGLLFQAGVATADSDKDARALAYCRRHGYGIEPVKGSTAANGDSEPAEPKGNASKADWVAYVVAQHGADQDKAEAMTRDELAARYGTKGSSDE
jgi:hypothetical protein